jgi:hypothetical protein
MEGRSTKYRIFRFNWLWLASAILFAWAAYLPVWFVTRDNLDSGDSTISVSVFDDEVPTPEKWVHAEIASHNVIEIGFGEATDLLRSTPQKPVPSALEMG